MNGTSRIRTFVGLAGFLLIAAFFLRTEHRAHLYGVLPFVFLLACPLLHVFMHGGHGGHGAHGPADEERTRRGYENHAGHRGGLQ